jgi:ADP-ribosylglycohydrolase
MALCLASSLVAQRDYDPYDQLVRYKWWFRDGYMSSTGQCFDIGSSTKQSLLEFERRQKLLAKKYKIPLDQLDFLSDSQHLDEFDVKCSEEGVAGNGALMRLAPVPLFFYLHPDYAVEYSGHSGEITHGDKKAYDACRYYGALIVAAVNGKTKEELLDTNFYENHERWFSDKPLHADIERIARGSYQKEKGYAEGIRGKGYIVSALEAALWAFWSDGGSFHKGVLAAINLGDDTDTTAAIYGQLAGACYGYRNLPEEWRDQVYAKDFIKCLSKWIVYEGTRWSPEASKASNTLSVTVQSPSDVGRKLSFDSGANLNEQSVSEKNPKHQLQSSISGSNTRLEPTSTSKKSIDLPKDSRTRSRTYGDVSETLKSGLNEQYGSNRPTSTDRLDQASSSERKNFKFLINIINRESE